MTVSVVTGGSGFIGTHLVSNLLARGDEVRVLDLEPPRVHSPRLRHLSGSITDAARVREALQGAERVYHLAAIAGLWVRDKRQFTEVNQKGTECVLAEAARAGVDRVVHCSTESILKSRHRRGTPSLINEAGDLSLDDMAGPYCRGKFLAEQAALQAAKRGQPVVVVNPTLPIGPGDHRLTPPARMLLGFLNGEHPAYLDSEFNMVDARDVAEGHVLAAERGRPGERYILGGQNIRMGELLALLESISGRPMPKRRVPYPVALGFAALSEFVADWITHRPPVAPLTGVRLAGSPMRFDNRKAREELGARFRPLRETLEDALADFRQRELLVER